ncbi:hypothetical protein HPP92_028315 [Vanilla planifolia]|uniref:Secreted protein n=1 Tax=Vanilla planifolia TaxID=51239 RepID=A0A835P7V3_VANPL|nr:hypothetical protein HPP92_028315 [Vanilla planifolia]KAG0447553.1 hypothetical protein HPP92_028284 [Vanilla planifolia]
MSRLARLSVILTITSSLVAISPPPAKLNTKSSGLQPPRTLLLRFAEEDSPPHRKKAVHPLLPGRDLKWFHRLTPK